MNSILRLFTINEFGVEAYSTGNRSYQTRGNRQMNKLINIKNYEVNKAQAYVHKAYLVGIRPNP